ncbi:MAG TPA: hypothetical protein PLX90_04925, partial [Anaerolineales bacterium]|nr:hypothetical protein [Anaerolineales bacterium]
ENKFTKYWYSIYSDYILKFLDGMPSEEVIYTTKDHSPMLKEFKKLHPVWLHNEIWNHYGKRFFDLFDVRNPELWEKYVNYCNEVKWLLYENRKRQEKIEKRSNPHDYFVPDEFL